MKNSVGDIILSIHSDDTRAKRHRRTIVFMEILSKIVKIDPRFYYMIKIPPKSSIRTLTPSFIVSCAEFFYKYGEFK